MKANWIFLYLTKLLHALKLQYFEGIGCAKPLSPLNLKAMSSIFSWHPVPSRRHLQCALRHLSYQRIQFCEKYNSQCETCLCVFTHLCCKYWTDLAEILNNGLCTYQATSNYKIYPKGTKARIHNNKMTVKRLMIPIPLIGNNIHPLFNNF